MSGIQADSYEYGAPFAAMPNMAVLPRTVSAPSAGTRAAMLKPAAAGHRLLRRCRLPPLSADPPSTSACHRRLPCPSIRLS